MKDFCSMAVPSDHNNHEQDNGHGRKADSKTSPLSLKSAAIITQAWAGVLQNARSSGEGARSSGKGVDIHKTLMEDLQAEEVRDHIGWCKTVMLALQISLIFIISTCVAVSFLSSYRRPLRLKSYYLGLETWNWSVLIMEIFCGLLVIRSICWESSSNWLKTTFNFTVWFSSVFFTWLVWLRPRMKLTSDGVREAVHYITSSLLCFSLGSISWLLKDMLCLRLEADLHFSQFFDRIRSTVLDLHGIRIIRSLGTWKFLKNNKKKNLIWLEVDQMKQKTVPIWILKQLVEMYTRDIENYHLEGTDPDATKDDQTLVTRAKKLFESIVCRSNREYPE
ncbi:hypothetical protein Ancab_029727 [Ancistrocladus abbreviatus]